MCENREYLKIRFYYRREANTHEEFLLYISKKNLIQKEIRFTSGHGRKLFKTNPSFKGI